MKRALEGCSSVWSCPFAVLFGVLVVLGTAFDAGVSCFCKMAFPELPLL